MKDSDLWIADPGSFEPVAGGDINRCYRVRIRSEYFFLKVNDAGAAPGMLRQEAAGLRALAEAGTTLCIPGVIEQGERGGKQYLVLEWLKTVGATRTHWETLGRQLARLHRQTSGLFGWARDNYIGNLPQQNNREERWEVFFAEQRLAPLARRLEGAGLFGSREMEWLNRAGNKWRDIFPPETPALLHGDLWQGNLIMSDRGPAIFDPAVYYGHREMDLAMTMLFGGFHPAFYDAYESEFPLAENWRERLPFFQLYPLMVHAVLFGGHYVQRCRDILQSLQ